MGRQQPVDLGEDTALQILALGQALLDEIGALDGIGQRAGDPQRAFPGQLGRGEELRPGAPRIGQHRLELALQLGIGIVDRDVDAVEEETRAPAGADDAAADQRRGLDLAHAHHRFLRESFSRTSSGPSTRAPIAWTMVTARSTSWPLVANRPLPRKRLSSSPTRTLPPASASMAA